MSSAGAAAGAAALPQSLQARPLEVGDTFPSTQTLRIASERAMLASGRTMVSDHRVTGGHGRMYRCAGAIIERGKKTTGGCQAHVKANKRADKHFYVTSVSFDHQNCAGGKKKPSVAALASEGAVVVNANRKVTAGGLSKTLKGTCGVELQPWAAGRLKRCVVGKGEKEQEEGIQRLASFMEQLEASSPGTITDCEWDAQGHLERGFVMLGGVAHFGTSGVQQVACMDFCHCKGTWNGVIGAICVKSSNNNVIQLATCIAPKENAAAYDYLITNACKNPEVAAFLNKPTTSIFTDKHKGSESSVPKNLGLSEHLRCGEHMLKNCGTVGPDGRMFFYEAARAPDKATCENFIQKISALNPAAGTKILEARRDDWAMYATRYNVVWDQVTSNASETANSMMGEKTREEPPFEFFQAIVTQGASKLASQAEVQTKNPDARHTPFAVSKFNTEMEWSKTCDSSSCGGGTFLVFPTHDRRHCNRVHLTFDDNDPTKHDYNCTCGFGTRWRIPCRHVIAVAKDRNEHGKLLELLDDGYRLDKFRAAASDERYRIIPPVWTDLVVNPAHKVPLEVEAQAGRPRASRARKRKKVNGEFDTTSRSYALHQAQAARGDNSATVVSATVSNAAASLSQSLSQGGGAGAAAP